MSGELKEDICHHPASTDPKQGENHLKAPNKVMNCIVVFNREKDKVLFCKRKKEPFKGRLNFVGGKVEPGETSEDAAYRELQEETGISRSQIRLFRLMDLTYYYQDFILEIYVGRLNEDVVLKEETNPLLWLPLDEDYTDRERFAGEQNIAHIINIALLFGR
jgi:mutator protein MutT